MASTLTVYRRSELESIGQGCLHRHRAIWIDGVEENSDLAMIGTGLHRVHHRYVLALVEAQTPQDMDLAREAFTEGIGVSQTPARLIPEMRKLWDWYAEGFDLQLDQYVTSEEREEVGGVSWTPDLVLARADELEIIDLKFGWTPPATEDELRSNFQARIYSFYAMQRWANFRQYRFTISAARFQKIISVVFKPSDLDNVEREVAALVAVVEEAKRTNHWPAVAGPSCRFCELCCPLELPAIAPKRFLTAPEAERAGQLIRAGEQQIKLAKQALKGYVASHGPVPCNGLVWDNRPTNTTNYPIQAVLDLLTKRGVAGAFDYEANPKMTISASSLKPVFKAYPELRADLASVAIDKTGYRFSCAKPGSDDEEGDE
jgi:hypothetical protein